MGDIVYSMERKKILTAKKNYIMISTLPSLAQQVVHFTRNEGGRQFESGRELEKAGEPAMVFLLFLLPGEGFEILLYKDLGK